MSKEYKQYIATCDSEHITCFGQAATAGLAFDEFMSNGEFDECCGIHGITAGEEVDVVVSGIIPFSEADEDMQSFMTNEGWQWIMDGPSEIKKAIAPSDEQPQDKE